MAKIKEQNGRDKGAKAPNKNDKGDQLRKVKVGKPISKAAKDRNRDARKFLSTGKLALEEDERKRQRDLRTLYVRFKVQADKLPTDEEQIKALDKQIKEVRVLRHGRKSDRQRIKFCFVEFGSADECQSAHGRLQAADFGQGQLYVDFVGEKARVKVKQPFKASSKKRIPINPTRLLVKDLPPSLAGKADKLKKLFKGCREVVIPKRSLEKSGGKFGFVQFRSPGDAKAAFDRCKDLVIDGQKVTVVFAKFEKREVMAQKVKSEEVKTEEKGSESDSDASGVDEVKEEDEDDSKDGVKEEDDSDDAEMVNDEESEDDDDDDDMANDEETEEEEMANDEESEDDDDMANDEESEEGEEEDEEEVENDEESEEEDDEST